ncbi:zinc transporter ZIP13 [Ambystoma mexicanum]|uniref:zinc transporter ZIP13 n=1 Tax=Ambystoma mexicanum TaxID=8296 RepID=UPI0037E962CB
MVSDRALSAVPALLLLQVLACSSCTPSLTQRCGKDDLFSEERLDAWLWSLIGSVLVGLSGVFPLLVIPIEAGAALKSEGGSQRLKQLLSFAIGGLLGDVFLHLLPEAWAYTCSATIGGGQTLQQQKLLGLWVIIGFLTFLVLEKMFPDDGSQMERREKAAVTEESSKPTSCNRNGYCNILQKEAEKPGHAGENNTVCAHVNGCLPQKRASEKIKMSGYLNLLANTIDNFTHGMAVAGSFLVSRKVGVLTTLAILLHEIPHEVGDFAILLRAGFDRWSAAKMQVTTAFGGIMGACFAICLQSPKGAGETIAWILPFTSGGFLYIALVNVVPDLLEEENPWYSLLQVSLLCCGVLVMVVLSLSLG